MPPANKDLGQHWLNDRSSLAAVADAADIGEGDSVFEIGPGYGSLTSVLLERGAEVIACEVDPTLALELQKQADDQAMALTVLERDVRQFDFSSLPSGYKVAGNIPYYLTSHIIQLLLEQEHKPARIGLLIQKEVAERAAAEPGDMSLLSVSAQFYADPELGPVVKKELFDPAPKVDSQVLSLTPKPVPEDVGTKAFFRLVKAGFGERRKKLINSLAGGLQRSKEDVEAMLEKAGIASTSRAQELSVEEWMKLYRVWDNGSHA